MRFLFVDRILNLIPEVSIKGIKHITADDYYLCKDETGNLCFVPSLIGEALGQLAAWNVMSSCDFKLRPVAGVVSSATLYRNAYLGETLLLESFIDKLDASAVHYHSVASIGDEIVFRIDGALGPMLPMEDFIEDCLIRRQFTEINRPGEYEVIDNQLLKELVRKPTNYCAPMTFDYIVTSEPGISISAVKKVTRAAAYFPDHFPNKPVLPLTVLLECKLNLALEFIKRANIPNKYKIHEIRRIKMNEFVYPGDVVKTTATLKTNTEDQLVLQFRSEINGKRICVLEMVMVKL